MRGKFQELHSSHPDISDLPVLEKSAATLGVAAFLKECSSGVSGCLDPHLYCSRSACTRSHSVEVHELSLFSASSSAHSPSLARRVWGGGEPRGRSHARLAGSAPRTGPPRGGAAAVCRIGRPRRSPVGRTGGDAYAQLHMQHCYNDAYAQLHLL